MITSKDKQFIQDVLDEVGSARAKFPSNKHITLAMAEEAGELVKSIMNSKQKPSITSDNDVYLEAVQAAAMALRVGVEGDPDFPYKCPLTEGRPNECD